jgi:FdrA protein
MGTDANKAVLAQSGLLATEVQAARADDLIIVVSARDGASANTALGRVDELLKRRPSASDVAYRPKSLDAAVKMQVDAQWVLVSVPGRYATSVAEDALRLGKNVFLYSDNVSLEDEVKLKQNAAAKGLLVMGPDCGTAVVNGIGLGFANRTRRGKIGLVGASGTGLQYVTSRIHQLGGGITHALGTGGRDISTEVGAISARQSLELLARDAKTELIVIVSKPPSAEVAEKLLRAAASVEKPVLISFIGYSAPAEQQGNLYFVRTLDEAARAAVALVTDGRQIPRAIKKSKLRTRAAQSRSGQSRSGFLRGLYSGGTLAYEALLILQEYLPAVYSNVPLDKQFKLERPTQSDKHTIVDLGEDEFTVGRLHPMMDNELRIQRIEQEAADPKAAVLLLDVVLGDGAHPDPAGELAPALEKALSHAKSAGRDLMAVAVIVGTEEDPQNMSEQIAKLEAVGVQVFVDHEQAVRLVGERVGQEDDTIEKRGENKTGKSGGTSPFVEPSSLSGSFPEQKAVDSMLLTAPLVAINAGLESFAESLTVQGAEVIQLDWRPPAGGNERLAGLLKRMKSG